MFSCSGITSFHVGVSSPKSTETIFPLESILELAAQNGFLTGEFYGGLWIDVGTQERLIELTKKLSGGY